MPTTHITKAQPPGGVGDCKSPIYMEGPIRRIVSFKKPKFDRELVKEYVNERKMTMASEIDAIKSDDRLYAMGRHYHQLLKCYEWKRLKYSRLSKVCKYSALLMAIVGTSVGTVTANLFVLGFVDGAAGLLFLHTNVSGYGKKANMCELACILYEEILLNIGYTLNGNDNDYRALLAETHIADRIVNRMCPRVNGERERYNKKYSDTDIKDLIPKF